MQEIACRWSPTLGRLEAAAEEIWGTKAYNPETDSEIPCVFFGVYGLPDFYQLWRHKGKRYVLWAGTDIIHFKNGYWLEDGGGIRVDKKGLAQWINKHCENYCENRVEYEALKAEGIEAYIVPSFLGDISKFPTSYKHSETPKLYASVSGDNFEQYGWHRIDKLAESNPGVEFHLYGNKSEWKSNLPNVIVHGRVPKEQMNAEIEQMQGGLRLTEFDGFSEIIAKSILMGQWPVSLIPYPHTISPQEIHRLKDLIYPNVEGKEYYLKIINKYPWNLKYAI